MPAFLRRILLCVIVVSGLVLAAPRAGYAQSDFESGYIITASGDTTRGLIDNLRWQRAPDRVRFAETDAERIETLGLSDIAGFGVGEYVYERHVLKVDQRPVERSKPYPSGDVMRRDTLFLRRLATGPLTLYSSYTARPHFFIETDERGIEELIYFVRLSDQTSGRRIKRGTFYRQQLMNRRTEACSDVSVRRLDFQRSALVEFVRACNSRETSDAQSTTLSRYQIGHVFSVRASWMSSKHTDVADPGTLAGLSPGVQYQLLIESRERYARGALLLGVGIQRMRGSRSEETTRQEVSPSLTIERTTTGQLTATVVDVSVAARIRMRKARWRPFVRLEGAVLFPLTYDARLGRREEYISTDRPDLEPVRIETRAQDWTAFQLGAGVGIGVEGPRFGTSLRLLRGFGYQRNDAEAPRLLDVELQMFVRL